MTTAPTIPTLIRSLRDHLPPGRGKALLVLTRELTALRRSPHPPQCAHWGTFPQGKAYFLPLCIQPIPCAPHGLDDAGLGGVVLDLVPDAAHVDGDGGAVAHIVKAPDGLEQAVLGKDDVGMLGQVHWK